MTPNYIWPLHAEWQSVNRISGGALISSIVPGKQHKTYAFA